VATGASGTGSALAMQFHRAPPDRYAPPYSVDLTTHPFFGDLMGVPIRDFPPSCVADPHVKNLTLLLEERFQHPFRARDLLDAGLLLEAVGPSGRVGLFAALDVLGYWPEYAELIGELRASALLDVSQWQPPDLRTRVLWHKIVRTMRGMGVSVRPLRGAVRRYQRMLLSGRNGHGLQRRWWRMAVRHVSVATGLRGGALAFGLPVEVGARNVPALRLLHRRHWSWAVTPIGVFLLVLGAEVFDDALDDLPAAERLMAEPSR
jgi:hypothetical protein